MKSCSVSFVIKEMQIEIIVRHHSGTNIKRKSNNKCWQGCETARTRTHCWWDYKLI